VERKTRANGRARREAILAAALEVFAERGYTGTSLTEIASRVGMTQPGILHHFETKDHLLLEVVNAWESRTAERVNEHVDRSLPMTNQIKRLAAVNKESSVEQLLLTTLSAEAIRADHPLHDHFVAHYRAQRAQLAQALQNGVLEGQVRDDIDAEHVAGEIIATLDGLRMQWLLDPERVELGDVLGAYADRVGAELNPRRRRARAS
jgi:AcrR family transcriptional regulator